MELKWLLISYLMVGILLGDGLIYNGKKNKTTVRVYQYLFVLLLGPIVVFSILIFWTIRKKPK